MHLRCLIAVAVLLSACSPPRELMASATFTNDGPDSLWSTAANWDPGVPTSGDPNLTITYEEALSISTQQDLASPFVLQSLVTANGAGGFSVVGSPLRFENLGAAPTVVNNSNTGAIEFHTAVELADTLTATSTLGHSINFAGQVSGTGGLSLQGNGGSVLSGSVNNTYTGLTTVGSGTALSLNKTNATAIVGDLHVLGGQVTVTGSGDDQIDDAATVTIEASTSSAAVNLFLSETIGNVTITPVGNASAGIGFHSTFRTLTLAGDVTVSANTTGTAGASISSNTGSQVDLGGASRTFNIGDGLSSIDMSVSSPIVNGALIKTGDGTLHLTGANTYAGGTMVSAGTLRGNTFSIQGDIVNEGTVTFTNGGEYAGDISGHGSLRFEGSGELVLSGNNSFTGGIQVSSSGGTLAGSIDSLPGNISIGGSSNRVRFDQAVDGTYAGVVSGAGHLQKDRAGILTLGAANTYSGTTTITAGTLRQGVAGALPTNRAMTIAAGATFDLNNFDATIGNLTGSGDITMGSGNLSLNFNSTHTYDGVISGTGSVTKNDGSITLNAAQTYTGGTILGNSSATIILGDSERLADDGDLTINGGHFSMGTFSERVADVTMTGGTISGSGTLTATAFHLDSGTVNVNLAGSGALTKNAGGVLNLSGTNTYSGTTTINAGALNAGVAGIPGDVVNNSVLRINQPTDASFAGVISGSGNLQKQGAGTVTLDSANTYAGSTAIISGALRQGVAGAIPNGTALTVNGSGVDLNDFDLTVSSLTGSSTLALGAANLVVDNTSSFDFHGGPITGTGTLTKQGTGHLTLSGVTTYTGGTLINEGILELSGSERLADSGDVLIDGGTLHLTNSETIDQLTLSSGSITGFGTLFANDYDVESGTISVTLAGSGALNKSTAGTVTLSYSNSYSGGTTVSAGTLIGTGPNTLQGDIVNDALVRFTSSSYTYSGDMSGTGAVEFVGGSMTFTGNNSYTGGTSLTNTFFTASTASLPGDVSFTGSGVLSLEQSFDGTFSGVISGSGFVEKRGNGELTITSANSFSGGFHLGQGSLAIGDDAALGTGPVTLQHDTSLRADGGPRTLTNEVTIQGSISFTGSEDLTLSDVTPISLLNGQILTSSNIGVTTVSGEFNGLAGSTVSVTAGELVIGDPASFLGFRTSGTLQVANGATMTLQSAGFADVSPLTSLSGGTLAATNGVSFGASENLIGHGTVVAKIAAQIGSVISATTGDLTLGDATSVGGFFSDGELYTDEFAVTLNDVNEAVLGSLTSLGNGTTGGTLTAGAAMLGDLGPHFLVEEGKNVIGRGTVHGNFKNNGHVIGDGTTAGERIVFEADWTVNGKGTFVNTLVLGNFAPGESPGVANGTNQAFGGTVTFELGGLTPGNGPNNHDQINDTSIISLFSEPTLAVESFNNFLPQVGDQFVIMTWQQGLDGTFGDLVVDPFFTSQGITFQPIYTGVGGAGNLTLLTTAVPEPGSALLAALAVGWIAVRRRIV